MKNDFKCIESENLSVFHRFLWEYIIASCFWKKLGAVEWWDMSSNTLMCVRSVGYKKHPASGGMQNFCREVEAGSWNNRHDLYGLTMNCDEDAPWQSVHLLL